MDDHVHRHSLIEQRDRDERTVPGEELGRRIVGRDGKIVDHAWLVGVDQLAQHAARNDRELFGLLPRIDFAVPAAVARDADLRKLQIAPAERDRPVDVPEPPHPRAYCCTICCGSVCELISRIISMTAVRRSFQGRLWIARFSSRIIPLTIRSCIANVSRVLPSSLTAPPRGRQVVTALPSGRQVSLPRQTRRDGDLRDPVVTDDRKFQLAAGPFGKGERVFRAGRSGQSSRKQPVQIVDITDNAVVGGDNNVVRHESPPRLPVLVARLPSLRRPYRKGDRVPARAAGPDASP